MTSLSLSHGRTRSVNAVYTNAAPDQIMTHALRQEMGRTARAKSSPVCGGNDSGRAETGCSRPRCVGASAACMAGTMPARMLPEYLMFRFHCLRTPKRARIAGDLLADTNSACPRLVWAGVKCKTEDGTCTDSEVAVVV